MGAKTDSLVLEIKVDDKGSLVVKNFRGHLDKSCGGMDKSLNKVKKSVGSLWKQFFAGQAVFAFVKRGFEVVKNVIMDAAKSAIDAAETHSKFGVVFQDVSKKAAAAAKDFAMNWGLSKVLAEEMMSYTGDLLTGFGFTGQAALDLSVKVNKLAVDLASFTNIKGGATVASKALTAAMLGETERAKTLGIVIRQDSQEFIDLVKHYQESEHMTLLQAKAMTALAIAAKQSKNAMGDYKRTSEESANVIKRIGMIWTDVKIVVGNAILKTLGPMFKKLKDWMEANREKMEQFATKAGEAIGKLIEKIKDIITFLWKWKDVIILAGKAWLAYFAISKIIAWRTAFSTALVAVRAKMLLMNTGIQGVITNFKFLKVMGAGNLKALTGSTGHATKAMSVLGKAVLAAGAFYLGWKFGEWISDITGLSAHFRELNKQDAIWIENRAKEHISEHTKQVSGYAEQIRSLGKELGITSGKLSVNALAVFANKEMYEKLNPAVRKIIDGFVEHNKVLQEAAAAELKAAEAAAEKAKKLELERIAKEKAIKAAKEMRKEMETYAGTLGILTKQGYGELRKETGMFLEILKKNGGQYKTNKILMAKVQEKAKELALTYKNNSREIPAGLEKILVKENEFELSMLSQIDQLKLLGIGLKTYGINLEGLSVNLQDVTEGSDKFELSMLNQADQMNIASGAAQMLGLSLLGINIPMIDFEKNSDDTAKGIKDIWGDVSKDITNYWTQGIGEMIAGTTSFSDFVLNSLSILTAGVGSMVGNLVKKLLSGLGAIAGPIGSLIGGIVAAGLSFLSKLFASHAIERAIERENYWMNMNDELKKSLKELAKEIGNVHAATSVMLPDIMDQSEITVDNFETWANRVKEIYIDLDNHYLSESEFMKTMGESWNKLIGEAQRLGTEGSTKILEIIREMKNRSMDIVEINEYINKTLIGGVGALQDYAAAGGKYVSEFSNAFVNAFQKQGKTALEIAEIMGSNLPAGLRKFIDENKNVLEQIEASQGMLEALGNTDYLTQEAINDSQRDMLSYYKQLQESGASEETILKALQPLLTQQLWYAEKYNLTLDDQTLALIKKGEQQGLVFEKEETYQDQMLHMQRQQVEIMGELAKYFGVILPSAMDKMADSAVSSFNRVGAASKKIGGDIGGEISWSSKEPEIPSFGDGGKFWATKSTIIEVGEKEPELIDITPKSKMSNYKSNTTTIGEFNVNIHLPNVKDSDDFENELRFNGELRNVIKRIANN